MNLSTLGWTWPTPGLPLSIKWPDTSIKAKTIQKKGRCPDHRLIIDG